MESLCRPKREYIKPLRKIRFIPQAPGAFQESSKDRLADPSSPTVGPHRPTFKETMRHLEEGPCHESLEFAFHLHESICDGNDERKHKKFAGDALPF